MTVPRRLPAMTGTNMCVHGRAAKPVSSKGIQIPVFIQINVRSLFFDLTVKRSDFGECGQKEAKLEYLFEAETENFSKETAEALENKGTPAQRFFSEPAKIG